MPASGNSSHPQILQCIDVLQWALRPVTPHRQTAPPRALSDASVRGVPSQRVPHRSLLRLRDRCMSLSHRSVTIAAAVV